jgi:hypothetical protein
MPKKKDWIDEYAENDALADEVMQRVLSRLGV